MRKREHAHANCPACLVSKGYQPGAATMSQRRESSGRRLASRFLPYRGSCPRTGAGALHPDTAHSTNGGNQKAHAAPTAHFWLLALPEPLIVSPTPGAAVVLSPVPLVPVRAQVTNVSAVLGRN